MENIAPKNFCWRNIPLGSSTLTPIIMNEILLSQPITVLKCMLHQSQGPVVVHKYSCSSLCVSHQYRISACIITRPLLGTVALIIGRSERDWLLEEAHFTLDAGKRTDSSCKLAGRVAPVNGINETIIKLDTFWICYSHLNFSEFEPFRTENYCCVYPGKEESICTRENLSSHTWEKIRLRDYLTSN